MIAKIMINPNWRDNNYKEISFVNVLQIWQHIKDRKNYLVLITKSEGKFAVEVDREIGNTIMNNIVNGFIDLTEYELIKDSNIFNFSI